MRSRVAIVASHVIQYQAPLYQLLATDPEIDLTVLYCSRHGISNMRDEDMQTSLHWDIDLLSGYRHRFLWNAANQPNRGYLRHLNPSVIELLRGRYDIAIFMLGWGSISALLGIAACRVARIPFFLYGDSSFPPAANTALEHLRAGALRLIFSLTTGFLVSGHLNAAYYEHYGADPRRFFLLPWAIDNERFMRDSVITSERRTALRTRYGIAPDSFVIIFSAKLVERKDPLTLVQALAAMTYREQSAILFLGQGPLRERLQAFAREQHMDNVHFAGFINQADLPQHYALGDVFVLPSTYEPRGAVVNEAMACGLPLIVSDRCGSIGDLVREGENAFIFRAGNARELAAALDQLVTDPTLGQGMAQRSREIIASWNFSRGVEGIKSAVRWATRMDRL